MAGKSGLLRLHKLSHHYGQSIKQVKAKMILSSHRGLYRFWKKHYRQGRWYLDLIAHGGLMMLAYVRIAAHQIKETFTDKREELKKPA